MLKRLAILAMFAGLQVQPLQPQSPSQSGDHTTQAQPQKKVESQPATINTVDNRQGCEECGKKDPVAEQGADKWVIRGFWLNAGLTVITLIIAIATLLQASAAKRQAEIASNSQRSWIVPKGVDKPDLSGNWVLRAPCNFEVYGSSPVRVFESQFRCHFVAAKASDKIGQAIPDLPDIPTYGTPTTLVESPEMGAVWPPGATFVVTAMLQESPIAEPHELQALKEGKIVLCVYGYIRYRDAFDKSKLRRTRFCYTCGVMNPFNSNLEGHFVLGGPPAYNDID